MQFKPCLLDFSMGDRNFKKADRGFDVQFLKLAKKTDVMKTLFEICSPRPDILKGNIRESDFAADLAQVIKGTAPPEYALANKFFANTHTNSLKV